MSGFRSDSRRDLKGPPQEVRAAAVSAVLVPVALVVGAAVLRAAALGPAHLWFDDAWMGLAARADGPIEAARTGLTSPGFAVALWVVTAPLGVEPLAAQLLPFLAGAAVPGVAYLVGRKLGLSRSAACLAGVLLLVSPVLVTYSSRVKPYTLEALLVLLLIWAGWGVLRAPASSRRWIVLTVAAVGSVIVSSVTALAGVSAATAGLMAAMRERGSGERGPRNAWVVRIAYTAIVGFYIGWYATYLFPRINPALRDYWSGYYLDWGQGWAGTVHSIGELWSGFSGAVSPLWAPLVLGALLASTVVVLRRHGLAVGLLLVGPLAGAFLLSALALMPFGGGRTDAHLLPGVALLIAGGAQIGGEKLATWKRTKVRSFWVPIAATVVVLAGIQGPNPYPMSDVRLFVDRLEELRQPREAVLVQYYARFGYGLYGPSEIEIVPAPADWQGFAVEVEDPEVAFLPHRPEWIPEAVARATVDVDTAWLLEAYMSWSPWMSGVLAAALREEGFEPEHTSATTTARLTRWRRAPDR